MFKDNENGRQEANAVPSQQFDASKRKVVQYNYVTSNGDGDDTSGGHGRFLDCPCATRGLLLL
jgi:hypothetical protein